MSLIRDSCVFYSRVLLIGLNLLVYVIMYALLSDVSQIEMSDRMQSYYEQVKVNEVEAYQTGALQNKIVLNGDPQDFNEQMKLVYFGQGYQQAKEDLWGMSELRNAVNERDPDRIGFAAYIDLETLALHAYAKMDSQLRMRLDAFADGVNAYIRTNGLLPIEFYNQGNGKFADWTGIDSLKILKLIHF